jgi:hypothetical protein
MPDGGAGQTFLSDDKPSTDFRTVDGVILMTTNERDTDGADGAGDTSGAPQDAVAEGELSAEQILERTVLYALEQGAEKLGQAEGFDPFTILIDGEELYLEEHPGESEEVSRASARRTVYQMERLCDAYVFCYDGYVELADGADEDGEDGDTGDTGEVNGGADTEDAGTRDALIAEYASKGDEQAPIVALMYHRHGDHSHFDDTLYQIGEADTLFGQDSSGTAGA